MPDVSSLHGEGVLFVTYGAAHIAKVAPVARALEQKGIGYRILALTLGYKKARQLGFEPLGYRDFMHLLDDPDRALAFGRELLADNSHPDVDAHESACYLGVNYAEWVDTHGETEARRRYEEGGRRKFRPVQFLKKIITALQPGVVVSTSSPRSEQAAIEAAAALGIPSLTMVDLFALPYDAFHTFDVRADRITVLSPFVADNLVEGGIDPALITVTGCPSFDLHFDGRQAAEAAAIRARLGWEGLKVVMWCGNVEEPGPKVDERYAGTRLGIAVEQQLRDWVAGRPDTALVIRYHPTQYHLFPQHEPDPRVHVSSPGQEAVEPLLHLADTVIVQASTVGFEAALIGKRVLSLSFSPMVINTGFDPGRLGYAEKVPSLEALIPALEDPHPARPSAHLMPPAGMATPRVVEHLLALLKEGAGAARR